MGLAEGTIRVNGAPARKPGYGAGNAPDNVGRPLNVVCTLNECDLPIIDAPSTYNPRKKYYWCGEEHRNIEARAYHLRVTYNLTVEEYDEMLESQGGVCAICGSDDPGTGGRGLTLKVQAVRQLRLAFHVDHNHITGENRGLLCGMCNRMIGFAQDSAENLRSGAVYLERTSSYAK